MIKTTTFTVEELLKDFTEWSGGFSPAECEREELDTYIEATAPEHWNRDELDAALTELQNA